MEKLGDLTFRQMDESSAREIVAWRYDPPYDVYNCDPDETETIVQCFLTHNIGIIAFGIDPANW